VCVCVCARARTRTRVSFAVSSVIFAVVPVFVGCESSECSKFEANQNVFAAEGWHLCNMSAAFSNRGGLPAETTDLVVPAGETVNVPRSTGFMVALFVP
jgi:hypothetical protein